MSRNLEFNDDPKMHDGPCGEKSILEYTDAGGEHWHCSKCGAWRAISTEISRAASGHLY